ncbi:hypothetical protein SIID45300_02402 [Candidatus Magnetaquicoccaceae bacterium FCR-1]|uniref:Zinc finger DksA/TraR C4-type domain-containing protein n=1 Tax=Candidatus Magnetaquiglobus chichijimensis TaxID=3141448 RepID=A0ABQ0CAZ2_9PROT|nr:TraR/DksA C4-type zinc finger protein [Magnetococcales bacterium]
MDEADQAQAIAEIETARLIAAHTRSFRQQQGRAFCEDCSIAIPQERLLANPGARRCLPCQKRVERGR